MDNQIQDIKRKQFNLKKHSTYIIRFAFVILSIIPIYYFFSNLKNEQFIINAMGNWFASLLGVFAGGLLAFEIANLQVNLQEKKNADAIDSERHKKALPISKWLKDELDNNIGRLNRLRNVLFEEYSSLELWDYLIAISDGFTTHAFERIVSEGLASEIPFSHLLLSRGYDGLIDLQQRIREGKTVHVYLYDKESEITSPNKELSLVKRYADLVMEQLIECSEPVTQDIKLLSQRIRE